MPENFWHRCSMFVSFKEVSVAISASGWLSLSHGVLGTFKPKLSISLFPWQSCCNKTLSAIEQGKCHFCLQNGHTSLNNKWSESLSVWAGSYLLLFAPWFTVCGSSLAHQYCKLNTKWTGDLLSLHLQKEQLSSRGLVFFFRSSIQIMALNSSNSFQSVGFMLLLYSAKSVQGFFFSLCPPSTLCLPLSTVKFSIKYWLKLLD